MRTPRTRPVLLAATAVLLASSVAAACPFCSAPMLTLTQQLAQSDAAVLVQWVDGKKAVEGQAGHTTYEILQVVRGEGLKRKETIDLPRYRAGRKGDLFLLLGSRAKTRIDWNSPLEVSETSFNYIAQAPLPEAPPEKRLAYFVKFLEFPDPTIATDAYQEFANAPYKDIRSVSEALPRARILGWLDSPETLPNRLGLYGLMLGLCGNEKDARKMRTLITEPTLDFRLGIDGIMSGYLLLTGEKGLDLIDALKLKPQFLIDADGRFVLDKDGQKQPLPFSETYAAMQAIRFMWTYGDGRIGKERLRQSMRLLLDRPEVADIVIADLARWKDWSVQDRLMKLYGAEEYDVPSIKRAIVRYMLASTKDRGEPPAGGDRSEKPPKHVEKGQQCLAALRKKDPETVEQAERFLLLQ